MWRARSGKPQGRPSDPDPPIRLAAAVFVAALPFPCNTGDDGGTDVGADSGAATGALTDSEPDDALPDPPGEWDRDDPASVCAVWRYERALLEEGSWSGDVASCSAGDNPQSRAAALRQINLMRWLARMPANVVTTSDRDRAAQQCALMMQAQGALSHSPSEAWACHGEHGAEAAAESVLASAPAGAAIDLFLIDDANESTLGHRRWLLSNELREAGIGSTELYSCVWVTEGDGQLVRDWIAWPPPGDVPADLMTPSPYSDRGLDDTGWTVQSDTLNLDGAEVRVWDDGVARTVRTWSLAENYGSRSAIAFAPVGWRAEAGHDYAVNVTGPGVDIRYGVRLTDCGD